MENKVETIEKSELERVHKIALQLLEKPKISMFMLIFPIVLIPFFQQLKKYGQQLQILKKELFFLNKIALEALKNSCSPDEAEKFFKISIFKPNDTEQIERLYLAQLEEVKELYNWYLNYETSENIPEKLKESSIKTLKISREIFSGNKDNLEFSLKLESIINKK